MKYYVKYFALIAFLCFATVLFAQFPPPPSSSPNVPIDGGLLSIIGAGAAYGLYKHKKSKKP